MKKLLLVFAGIILIGANYTRMGQVADSHPAPIPMEISVSIGEIYANPSQFMGVSVSVKASVDQIVNAIGYRLLIVSDSTGTLWVTPHPQRILLPKKGDTLQFTGKLSEVYVWGSQRLYRLEEE
ncbi:MAG: hypothetical protein R3D00_10570 [Bacteroidia bacterium]